MGRLKISKHTVAEKKLQYFILFMATILESKKTNQKSKIPPDHVSATFITFQFPWMAVTGF